MTPAPDFSPPHPRPPENQGRSQARHGGTQGDQSFHERGDDLQGQARQERRQDYPVEGTEGYGLTDICGDSEATLFVASYGVAVCPIRCRRCRAVLARTAGVSTPASSSSGWLFPAGRQPPTPQSERNSRCVFTNGKRRSKRLLMNAITGKEDRIML